ncbi:C39 family peptidase [Leptospira alexanderi]|uniref:C39 family peptidase n=1 Tax=Leptospira alexanderi TaxID=100053 RepID=UPI000990EEE3
MNLRYHSFWWYFYVPYFQIRTILLNTRFVFLIRKRILNQSNLKNEYLDHLLTNQNYFYKKLVSKYPEYRWTKKYIDLGYAHVNSQIGLIAATDLAELTYRRKFYSFWSYSVSVDQCKQIISLNIPIITKIKIKTGIWHCVTIVGFNDESQKFIVHDPLGDYFSNYRIYYGANVEFPFDHFQKINSGNPIYVSLTISADQFDIIKKIMNSTAYKFI